VFPNSTPSLTGGQVNPLLLDAAGNLRVNVEAGNCNYNAGNNCITGFDETTSGANGITAASSTGSGTVAPALNAAVTATTNGAGTIAFTTSGVTGTWTISYKGSSDGGATYPWSVYCQDSGGNYHTSQANSTETAWCNTAYLTNIEWVFSAYTSSTGTLTVNYTRSLAAPSVLTYPNGSPVSALAPSDTMQPTQAGLPVTNNPQIFSGITYSVRQYACQQTAPISITSSTTSTAIVAAVAGQVVYVCGYQMNVSGTSPTFEFTSAGTCGSGDSAFGAAQAVTSGSTVQFSFGQNSGFNTATGQNLCLKLGGTTPSASGWVQYAQFTP